MRKSGHILFFVSIVLFVWMGPVAIAQQDKIDSLHALLRSDGEDTNKINHLNGLARLLNASDPDSSVLLSLQALQLAESQNWKKGIASSCIWLGWCSFLQGNYPRALEYDFKALKVGEEIGNKKIISTVLGSIGSVYYVQKDYTKALDYFSRALKIDEALNDSRGISRHLVNIGILYDEQKEYKMALDYYFRALKLDEQAGNRIGVAAALSNIGTVYAKQAVSMHDQAEAEVLLKTSMNYYFKALKIAEELEDKNGMASAMANIGSLYSDIKQYAQAEKYLQNALQLNKEVSALEGEQQNEELLAQLYARTNRYELALEHYKRAVSIKDTLFNEGKNEEITRKEMNYEFEKKEAATKAETDKQAAIAEAEKQRQRVVLVLVLFVLSLVLVFAGFIFRALRITREQKRLIEQQTKIVEEKQKEILDSIHYAKRIQTALLPTDKYIDKTLKRLIK